MRRTMAPPVRTDNQHLWQAIAADDARVRVNPARLLG